MTNAPDQSAEGVATNMPGRRVQHRARADGQANDRGELLRQLATVVLDGPRSQAPQRFSHAAAQGAQLVATSQADRLAVTVVLLTAGQAAGVGQEDVIASIRDAFHLPPPRTP